MYFYSSSFVANRATANGGAVALWNLNSAVHFDSCSFIDNAAAATGGAVYFGKANGNGIADSTVATNVIRMTNCDLTGNTAAQDGGMSRLSTIDIYTDLTTLRFLLPISGALFAYSFNSLLLTNSRLTGNVAIRRGGALYLAQNNFPVTLTASTVLAHNTAQTGGGGAIYVNIGANTLSLNATAVAANNGKGAGGGLYVDAGNRVLVGSAVTFTGNVVAGAGGAVAVFESELSFMGPGGVTIRNNSAVAGESSSTSGGSNGRPRPPVASVAAAGGRGAGIGGGMLVDTSVVTFGPGAVAFTANTADSAGSALYVVSSATAAFVFTNSTAPVSFVNNRCKSQGRKLMNAFFPGSNFPLAFS